MKHIVFAIILALVQLTLVLAPTLAHGHGHSSSSVRTYSRKNGAVVQSHRRAAPHASPYSPRTRTHRSRAARADFQHQHPCPATGRTSGACPGYVVDHIVPLKRDGADAPGNM